MILKLELRAASLIHMHGGVRAAARVLKCDPGYLHRIALGRKANPGPALLRRMGLRRVVYYENIRSAPQRHDTKD